MEEEEDGGREREGGYPNMLVMNESQREDEGLIILTKKRALIR
jgi:hypothetical protein